MAAITYAPDPSQEVTVERVATGTGKNATETDTHLIRYRVTNVYGSVVKADGTPVRIAGKVEVNGVTDKASGPLLPGESWEAVYAAPGLALGSSRVGWSVQEV